MPGFSLRSHIPSLIVYTAASLVIFRLYLDSGTFHALVILRNILLINSLAICAGFILDFEIFTYERGRTGGFLLNANQAGYTACLLLVIQLYLINFRKDVIALLILSITILSLFFKFFQGSVSRLNCKFVILSISELLNKKGICSKEHCSYFG